MMHFGLKSRTETCIKFEALYWRLLTFSLTIPIKAYRTHN